MIVLAVFDVDFYVDKPDRALYQRHLILTIERFGKEITLLFFDF